MFLYDSIAGNVYLPRFEGKKNVSYKIKNASVSYFKN